MVQRKDNSAIVASLVVHFFGALHGQYKNTFP
jgi:hypothetical protein